jgi:dihydroorotate dehydrogenase
MIFSLLLLYDIYASHYENLRKELPAQVQQIEQLYDTQYTLFNYSISFPLGIPACAIMTSKWIPMFASAGFNIFTYKTVRSEAHQALPFPNICFIDCPEQIMHETIATAVNQTHALFDTRLCIANSFGTNCGSLFESCADIAKARRTLREGQLLIVSIFGTQTTTRSQIEDFAYIAQAVAQAGAQVIEINLSCPNLNCIESALYKKPENIYEIGNAVVQAVTVPVIIKVGVFDSEEQMRAVLKMATAAGIKGICGINSVPMRVMATTNEPYFGCARSIAGVSGYPIHELALEFVRTAKKIIDAEQLPLIIFATGGIVHEDQFDDFFQAGATVSMAATGVMADPHLAVKYYTKKGLIK